MWKIVSSVVTTRSSGWEQSFSHCAYWVLGLSTSYQKVANNWTTVSYNAYIVSYSKDFFELPHNAKETSYGSTGFKHFQYVIKVIRRKPFRVLNGKHHHRTSPNNWVEKMWISGPIFCHPWDTKWRHSDNVYSSSVTEAGWLLHKSFRVHQYWASSSCVIFLGKKKIMKTLKIWEEFPNNVETRYIFNLAVHKQV